MAIAQSGIKVAMTPMPILQVVLFNGIVSSNSATTRYSKKEAIRIIVRKRIASHMEPVTSNLGFSLLELASSLVFVVTWLIDFE